MKAYLKMLVLVILGLCSQSFGAMPNVKVWGDNSRGQYGIPPNLTNAVAVSAGGYHCLVLCSDNTIVAWGGNDYGQSTVPPNITGLTAISAGGGFSLALRSDGTIMAWGYNGNGECNVPANLTNAIAISAGYSHSLAIRSDGTVVAWGNNESGQCDVPSNATNVVMISAGGFHSLALRSDGTIVAWGSNSQGQCNVPSLSLPATGLAGGFLYSLALQSNGKVVAWGENSYGQCDVPVDLTDVLKIYCGSYNSLALRSDGFVQGWGGNQYGQGNLPTDLTNNVVDISSGFGHNIALLRIHPSIVIKSEKTQTVGIGATVTLEAKAGGSMPLIYQWYFGSDILTGETNTMLTLTNVQTSQSGEYHLVVTNQYGSAVSETLMVSVVPLLVGIHTIPVVTVNVPILSLVGEVGTNCKIQYRNAIGTVESWIDLTTLTLTEGQQLYPDFSGIGQVTRFYRAVKVPK